MRGLRVALVAGILDQNAKANDYGDVYPRCDYYATVLLSDQQCTDSSRPLALLRANFILVTASFHSEHL